MKAGPKFPEQPGLSNPKAGDGNATLPPFRERGFDNAESLGKERETFEEGRGNLSSERSPLPSSMRLPFASSYSTTVRRTGLRGGMRA